MNRCDTCIYAEYEWSELHMRNECVDCTQGYRRKFESDEDCKRYEKAGEMAESDDTFSDYLDMPYQFDNMTGSMNL